MQQMVATKAFRFAGREVQPGDPITATDGEAKTLRALQRAKPASAYQTRVERVEKPTNTPGRKPRTPRQEGQSRRGYRRRDMIAED